MNTILLNTISDGKVVIKRGEGNGGGNSGGGNSGGGAVSVSPKAVNFRDYDGTILHAYSKEEFLALNELPPLPTREGLICQEWNWDFANAVEYVSEYGVLEVGATYITDDEKTRLYIRIAAEGRMDVPLYFQQDVANGVTIDWGDGSELQTLSGTGNVNTTHHYNAIGNYCIILGVAEGCTLGFGLNSSSYCVMGNTSNNYRVYCNMLQKVEIGKGVTSIGSHSFRNCLSLASIVIPHGVTSIGGYAFCYCSSLASIVIPQGVTTIDSSAFNTCYSLASVVIPQGVTTIGTDAFRTCYSLASLVIPQGVTTIGSSAFNTCYSLASVVIPQGVTTIDSNTFRECSSLASIVIPQGVTSIGSNAFYYCYGVAFYDFSALESVPSLGATNAFTSIPSDCKIIVPDALYDEWIAATNWSTYADRIIKKSEWDTSQS